MNRFVAAALLMLPIGAAGWCADAAGGAAYAHPELLVETAWLDENIIRPEVVVVDLRSRDTFDQGHIPGAFQLDENSLVRKDGLVPSVVSPEEFKALVEAAGIGDGSHVIAVDEMGGKAAARLWWTLGYYGFDNVSLLDGGYDKWQAEGRASTVEYPFHRAATFTPHVRPERLATADQVRDWKKTSPSGVVVDVRSTQEYEGKLLVRMKRRGHIPGAVNVPWDEVFTQKNDSRVMKSQAEITALLSKAGISKETPAVIYCMDGRRASHMLFSMALVGLGGANFVGSWAAWSARSDLPIEAPKEQERPNPRGKKPQGKKPGLR